MSNFIYNIAKRELYGQIPEFPVRLNGTTYTVKFSQKSNLFDVILGGDPSFLKMAFPSPAGDLCQLAQDVWLYIQVVGDHEGGLYGIRLRIIRVRAFDNEPLRVYERFVPLLPTAPLQNAFDCPEI